MCLCSCEKGRCCNLEGFRGQAFPSAALGFTRLLQLSFWQVPCLSLLKVRIWKNKVAYNPLENGCQCNNPADMT